MTARHGAVSFRPLLWMESARCATTPDPDLWFPDPGHRDRAAAAKAVCAACPVRAECAGHARAASAGHGVWGGLAPEERDGRRARRKVTLTPAARQRRAARLRDRRRRLREAAAAGDPAAIKRLEADRARKRINRQEVAA